MQTATSQSQVVGGNTKGNRILKAVLQKQSKIYLSVIYPFQIAHCVP